MHRTYLICCIFVAQQHLMTIVDSSIKSLVKKVHMLKAGPVYIFDNFIATEFYEGATVDYDCIIALYGLLDAYSTPQKPFSIISNRINSYAINTSDFMKAYALSDKKYPSAVVTTTEKGLKMSKFLKKLLNCNSQTFSNLDSATHWANQQIPTVC